MYTAHARHMARAMVDAGCARAKVGPLMTEISAIFGVKINGARKMSRRTVSRAVLEGGIAARMQQVYELSLNEAVTISADSTSNRGNNYEASKLQHRVPNYKVDPFRIDPNSTPKVREAGVESTLDHGADHAVAGWKLRLQSNADLFNKSPLAHRLKKRYTIRQFAKSLKGMNGDHASVEKCSARGMGDWKHDEAVEELGEEALEAIPFVDLLLYLQAWNEKKITAVGGIEAWKALSPQEQAACDKALMSEIVEELGKEAYDALSPEDQRRLDLFIWAGCCMHKDLNSFKGGNTEMMAEWERLGIAGPMILANKANSAALKRLLGPNAQVPSTLTEAEQAAFEASTRGAVKLCALAGAILNNKDDKKGEGDRHTEFMSLRTGKFHPRFPDTSNTRFGSFGLAAGELIKFLEHYAELMEVIEFSKTSPGLTNIQKNLRDALRDARTQEELCALILYFQAISVPYLRFVRGPGTEGINALDLGPLHAEVRQHIQNILDNPDLLFSDDFSHVTATLDGKEWGDLEAITAVRALMPELPYLKPVTLAFFRGALATFIRFSSEFAPGGLIDGASATERQEAWMPATNDANESTLAVYRVKMRQFPSLTLHQFNAMAMYRRNDTQDFIDAVFTYDDHLFIMREARKEDASGLERDRKKALAEFRVKLANMRKEKEQAKREKAVADLRKLLEVALVTHEADIYSNLTIPKLHEQLNAFRLRGVPGIKANSTYRNKEAKQTALAEAFKVFRAAPESFPVPASILAKFAAPETQIIQDWAAEEEMELDD
ncbi:hypothetical protein C8R47DRAFT_1235882, partial [Mycena vitilis]